MTPGPLPPREIRGCLALRRPGIARTLCVAANVLFAVATYATLCYQGRFNAEVWLAFLWFIAMGLVWSSFTALWLTSRYLVTSEQALFGRVMLVLSASIWVSILSVWNATIGRNLAANMIAWVLLASFSAAVCIRALGLSIAVRGIRPHRWRWQFSLRSIMTLVAIVAFYSAVLQSIVAKGWAYQLLSYPESQDRPPVEDWVLALVLCFVMTVLVTVAMVGPRTSLGLFAFGVVVHQMTAAGLLDGEPLFFALAMVSIVTSAMMLPWTLVGYQIVVGTPRP